MTRPVVIVNQGSRSGADALDTLAAALRAHGVDADVRAVAGKDAGAAAQAALDQGCRLVVAAGGDGTVSAVAGALAGSQCTLGVVPLGTLNHFARDLGIPADVDKAAAILAAGTARQIDLARLNDRVFVNNCAIGLYPLMVIDRDLQQNRLGRSKRLAMLVASARALARFDHHRLTLTVNAEERHVETPLLFVGNNDYRIGIGGAGQRDSLEDGRLCVFVMRRNSRIGLIAAAARALFGRERPEDLLRLDDVERLVVDSPRRSLAVAVDGEVAHSAPPLEFRILPRSLSVIVP